MMDETTIKLSEIERQALLRFVAFLQTTMPEEIVSISLFGSKARGDSNQESDVDVLVITVDDDRKRRWNISTEAARISLEFDLLLSPRVIGAPRWEQMRGFTLYQNVVREAAGLDIENGELVLEPAGIG